MKLPHLPRSFFSSLGAVAVRALPKAKRKTLAGRYQFDKRRIQVSPDLHRVSQWVTMWHEATHVLLIDSGVQNTLDAAQTEAICDAVGNYLTAMMLAGWLTVTPPHSGKENDMKT